MYFTSNTSKGRGCDRIAHYLHRMQGTTEAHKAKGQSQTIRNATGMPFFRHALNGSVYAWPRGLNAAVLLLGVCKKCRGRMKINALTRRLLHCYDEELKKRATG